MRSSAALRLVRALGALGRAALRSLNPKARLAARIEEQCRENRRRSLGRFADDFGNDVPRHPDDTDADYRARLQERYQ